MKIFLKLYDSDTMKCYVEDQSDRNEEFTMMELLQIVQYIDIVIHML